MSAKQHASLRGWGFRLDGLRSQSFEIYQQVRQAERDAPDEPDACIERLYAAADAAFELACQLVILADDASGALEESEPRAKIN